MSGESLPGTPADKLPLKNSKVPPVTEVGVVALALVVTGGIYMSSYYPNGASLVLPTVMVVVALALMSWNLISVFRADAIPKFPLVKVGKWALLVYLVIAGMLEYVFIFDGTTGTPLVLLSLMLLVFAVDVPTIMAFTVARFYTSPNAK